MEASIRTDRIYLGLGEGGLRAFLAARGCSVPDLVGLIFRRRSPAKVRQVVVERVSVPVAALVALWLRPNERLEHEDVGCRRARHPVFRQTDLRSAFAPVFLLLQDAVRFQRAHAAMIRDIVMPFVAWDRKPSFHSSNGGT